MLTTYAQSTGPDGDLPPDGFLAACTWALANRDLWEKWVPKETDCSSGLGLVDLQQNFVTEVSAAVECATCPPGRASVKSGNTRVCSKCAAGSSQNLDCRNFEKYVGPIIPGLHHVVPLSQGMLWSCRMQLLYCWKLRLTGSLNRMCSLRAGRIC